MVTIVLLGPQRSISVGAACCLSVVAAFLVIDRGGVLSWVGTVLGAVLFLKILLRPSPRDAMLCVAVLATWAVSWFVTWKYVVSTWESGEVVHVEVDGGHTARLWVLDLSDGPAMYYDAPPGAASQLLAGAPLSMTRHEQISRGCASASLVEELPEHFIQDVFNRMLEKYGSRNTATDVFYALLGVKRNRVGLLIQLTPCE